MSVINYEQTKFVKNNHALRIFANNLNKCVNEVRFKKHHKYRRKKSCFPCRSQSNSLVLILGVYVVIFSVASVILIRAMFLQYMNEREPHSENEVLLKQNDYVTNNFESTHEKGLFSRRLFKEFEWPFKSSIFNCSNLSQVKKFKYLTSGWTKNVFSFEHNGKNYALKSVNSHGMDMKICMEKESMKTCLEKASLKMYKEYILSRELYHSNIIKVLAWCISSSNFSNEVAIVTELCSPLDTISMLKMSFLQRLKIILELSQLILYLAHSPLGSVAINDFRRQQFVLCGGTLKLSDLDDLSIEEPKCASSIQCSKKKFERFDTSDEVYQFSLNCVNSLCLGYNEKQNVVNAYKHFVNLFLNITTPHALMQNVENVLQSYTRTWDANVVHKTIQELYLRYEHLKNKFDSVL